MHCRRARCATAPFVSSLPQLGRTARRRYNEVTHESVWQQPAATAWTARSVENHYYVNHVTGEVQRERPAVLGHLDEARFCAARTTIEARAGCRGARR